MNPEAPQSPLPLPGAESLVSTGLPLKTHSVPESRAEGAPGVPGGWENRESESGASRSETRVIWQLNARGRNRARCLPSGHPETTPGQLLGVRNAPHPPPPASSGARDGRRLGTVGWRTCPRFHAGLDDAKGALGKADERCQLARTKEDRNGHMAKLISLTQLQVLRGNVLRCF